MRINTVGGPGAGDKGKHEKAKSSEGALACSPMRETWHGGEQSWWGGAETGQATQQVEAEPRLELRVIKAQPFVLSPTTLNVRLVGKAQEQEDTPDLCV